MLNPNTCNFEYNKACKIDEYLDIKNSSCRKRLIGKLILECDDKILNATEDSLDDKKEIYEKNNCLIHTISLIIICTLLFVVSIDCHYYYTRLEKKQKNFLRC